MARELTDKSALETAAPELLMALSMCLSFIVDDLGECGYEPDQIDEHEAVIIARAAIKKATGEQ